jgi:hypothetical protein
MVGEETPIKGRAPIGADGLDVGASGAEARGFIYGALVHVSRSEIFIVGRRTSCGLNEAGLRSRPIGSVFNRECSIGNFQHKTILLS